MKAGCEGGLRREWFGRRRLAGEGNRPTHPPTHQWSGGWDVVAVLRVAREETEEEWEKGVGWPINRSRVPPREVGEYFLHVNAQSVHSASIFVSPVRIEVDSSKTRKRETHLRKEV